LQSADLQQVPKMYRQEGWRLRNVLETTTLVGRTPLGEIIKSYEIMIQSRRQV
jgi:hypothetical protein